MRTFNTYADFEQQVLASKHALGFQEWTVVQVHALTDQEKSGITSVDLRNAATACLVTIVHTTNKACETVLVADTHLTAQDIQARVFDSYIQDIDNRILGVDPTVNSGFFEYDSWEEFKSVWLVRDGKPVVPHIMPLLFDLPSDVEFLTWQKSGKTKLHNRRLVVTLYAYSKDRYYTMFVNNVDEADIEHYLVLLKAQRGMTIAWKA